MNYASRALWRGLLSCIAATLALAAPVASRAAHADGAVNIYSYREPKLIDPLLKAFTAKTGIKTNVIYSGSGLVERLTAEGKNSPADVLLTNEFGLLIQAVNAGVTAPVSSPAIEKRIPASLRDPDGHWIGLTRRARIVYASKERVKQDTITYEELADPKWKGRICSRSGQHTYNVSLIAAMIAHLGEEKAEAWLNGVKANLARKPAGGDREQVRDVKAGLCDLAIGNTYYMVAMQKIPAQKEWADSVKILFPNANDRGTHVNISGMSLLANAPNKANAVALMEYLVSDDAQTIYADANGEYPAAPDVKASQFVQSWGELKPDTLPLSKIAELRKKASKLVDKVHFDAGPNS
ncbi:MAG TPA: Fe(3+) ABC transporter substrate-binding protein [Hyphomicrobium sp.]|nr:Fe(3+) ABC transporter substrate-binding protein [Hyphomicrobium sp.]